jgi:predicted RNase H-like nuclease
MCCFITNCSKDFAIVLIVVPINLPNTSKVGEIFTRWYRGIEQESRISILVLEIRKALYSRAIYAVVLAK